MTKKQLERKVMELSATLPTLRPKDKEWIDSNFRERWHNKGLCYYVIMERCRDYQVIRWYYKSRMRLFECMQIWLNAHEEVTLAKRRFMRYDGWVETAPMSPKRLTERTRYSYLGDVRFCPCSELKVRSLLPELKRNGLRSSLHGLCSPYQLCKALLSMPRVETLWKARQYGLANYFYWCNQLDDNLWQSIRIALRHGYMFTDYTSIRDWCDMIRDMEYVGADTRNPNLICPADLAQAHQHWITVMEHKRDREHYLKELRMVKDYEPIFKATREQFFKMVLKDEEITVKVIPTAKGIKEEGRAMHHCVGGYYNKCDSLILSATINGNRVETIEVSLKSYKLVQSRGLQNKSTKYHKRIIRLVNDNLDLIRVLNENHKDVERKLLKKLKAA